MASNKTIIMSYTSLSQVQKAELVIRLLKEDYPVVRTPLFHRNAFEFLIAVMLSPQTNDVITNKVTPVLFARYDSPEALAEADPEEVFNIIKPINYNKTKVGRIISASKSLIHNFNGKVPHDLNDLLTLPGVGRKVGNVIANDWYATSEKENPPYDGDPDPNRFNSLTRGAQEPSGFVVDTHVARVSQALQLATAKTPDKIEIELMELLDPSEWMGTSLRLIFHGREVFQAKKPEFLNFPKWAEIYQDLGY